MNDCWQRIFAVSLQVEEMWWTFTETKVNNHHKRSKFAQPKNPSPEIKAELSPLNTRWNSPASTPKTLDVATSDAWAARWPWRWTETRRSRRPVLCKGEGKVFVGGGENGEGVFKQILLLQQPHEMGKKKGDKSALCFISSISVHNAYLATNHHHHHHHHHHQYHHHHPSPTSFPIHQFDYRAQQVFCHIIIISIILVTRDFLHVTALVVINAITKHAVLWNGGFWQRDFAFPELFSPKKKNNE